MPVFEAQEGIVSHHPGDAGEDHGAQNRAADDEIAVPLFGTQFLQQWAELKPDQRECQHIGEKDDRLPHRIGFEPQ